MSSRKEEERNEKIIRGLMKLPPNRKCINCNSVGPQYVCTNFWTFVCVTCSGIHREFTHRVKSVSMSKFTSQEVEALQNGGNQRARETFLKDWDTLRQRLPDSSNIDKVRDFIKNVYVDRRYASGKSSEKPPRDMQDVRHREEEMRRANSYHSYSQSPPYDYQYEERRYGKQVPGLTRKHGSEKTLYEGRFSNFSSPSRFSGQMHEDSFAHGRSNSRASDFSVSSGPFGSEAHSPTFQIDTGLDSVTQTSSSRELSNERTEQQTTHGFPESSPTIDASRVLHLQRAASLGSLGSFDSNPVNVASETKQSAETIQVKQFADASRGQSSLPGNFGGLDLFDAPSAPETISTLASATDLFQLPEAPTPPVDMLPSFSNYSCQGLNSHQSSQTIPSDLFSDMSPQQQASTLDQKPVELIPKNEGWANFDLPQNIVRTESTVNSTVETMPSIDVVSLGNSVPPLLQSTTPQWPGFGDINELSSSMPNLWHEGQNNYQAPYNAAETQAFEQSWNAFEDPSRNAYPGSIQQMSHEVADHVPSTSTNQLLDEFLGEGIQRIDSETVPSHANGFSYTLPPIPYVVPPQSHATDYKSTNPFDLPCDSDSEIGSMFMDMSSLQEALPSDNNPHSVFQPFPWFPQNQGDHSIPAAQQDPLGFIGAEVPSTPILTVPAQGPVASVGGNPFD